MKKNIFVLLILFILISCAEKEKLEPVVTLGVPEKEKVVDKIELDDFYFDLYTSYAALVRYNGNESYVIIPDRVEGLPVLIIGEKAFWGNENLKNIKLPENLRIIDRWAFQKCIELNTVEFNSRLETISDYAFNQTAIKELNFPVSLASIGKYSFSECVGFTSLEIPGRVGEIGRYAFYGCTEMVEFKLNNRLTRIQDHVFYNCTALVNADIPRNITEIAGYAFAGCVSLVEINIPDTVVTIGEGQFHGTPNVTVITPAKSAAAKFCDKNGVNWREPIKNK